MELRVLEIRDIEEAARELRALDVHKGGVGIMAPKSVSRVIKVSGLSSDAFNILKQEMLSAGGDCAVAWDAFIKRKKNTDGIIIGSAAQLARLCEKLRKQPLGLAPLGRMISALEEGCAGKGRVLRAGKYKLNLGKRAHIMGVLNVTPDSFSDGGMYFDKEYAVARALKMQEQGADIIDIGGESTRPGARTVPAKEECRRVIPVIKELARKIKVPISVDTTKSEVAREALDAGASMVNDVSGLRKDRGIAKLVSRRKAAIVLMHMKGTPATMQDDPVYKDLIGEICSSLRESIETAKAAGIGDDSIVIDPGIGFGKTVEHNLAILRRLREFRSLGCPVMVGPSRKRFIGRIAGAREDERQFGTAASVALSVQNGADIVRVHDVKQMKQALQVTEAIIHG
ncbi:MAG TPA: dihydropteroate synthase [Candidatus Omnitrophota bacterium]|nr:dihydropteroate synthase [Candidatus Omnitrophota bacterium]HPN66594.1 dihydropteroate synthase [Candidatus Omnitrophota bacterium]HRZ67257.1 dihydropteroate synthase [Candidatus Omnitrophota bacterium]